jgi:histone H3/H4
MNSKASRAKAAIQTTQTAQPSPIERSLALLAKKSKSAAAGTGSMVSPLGFQIPLIGERVQDLVKSVDPSYVLENQAEEQLLELADDFLEKICRQSVRVAKHRGSDVVDVRDVQLMLQTQWGIVIPGLGPPPSKKRSQITKSRASISAAIPPPVHQPSIRQRLSAPPPLSGSSIGNDVPAPTSGPIASGTTLPPFSATSSNKRPSTTSGGGSSNKKAKIDSSKQ